MLNPRRPAMSVPPPAPSEARVTCEHADRCGWALSLIYPAIIDFDKSIIKYPNITRYVGGASNDLVPDLQHPDNPVPLLKDQIERLHIGGSGG